MSLMKKLTSGVVASSLVLGMVGTAFASGYTPESAEAAAQRMVAYKIVNGVAPNDLGLGQPITRAQFVTVMVRAFGQGDNAALLVGANTGFEDIDAANQWATGYIAMAKALIEKNGHKLGVNAEGTQFNPGGNLTAAEAVAFLMKFLGVQADNTLAWPASYLTPAVEKGVITAEDRAQLDTFGNAPATRGFVFYLADQAFVSFEQNGKNVYQTYSDTEAPKLSVDAVADTTTEAESVTITGSVEGQSALTVDYGQGAMDVAVDADGKFSYEVPLEVKENAIVFTAVDLAGNESTSTTKVTRTPGVAASIEAEAVNVAAGQTVDVKFTVKDAKGNVIEGAAVEGTSDVGTFADGKFTAQAEVATGTLTLTLGELTTEVAVNISAGQLAEIKVEGGATSFAVGAQQTFKAVGLDEQGNEVALDDVTWSATGGVINQNGEFVASTSGNVTITATAGELTGTLTATAYGKATAIKLSTPANIVANGSSTTTITASAVDANGNVDLGFTGTATFSSNNIAVATIDSTTTTVSFVNGVATATVKSGTSVGASTISASVSGMSAATAIITTDKQVLTSATSSIDPGTIAADSLSSAAVKIVLLDQAGKPMLAGNAPSNLNITATTTSSSVANAPSISYNNYTSANPYHYGGTVTSAGALGSTTFTFTLGNTAYSSLAIPSVTLTSATVGSPYKLGLDAIADKKVGTSATAVVRLYDYNGNQTTGQNGQTVTLVDTTTGTTVGTGTIANGKASISFTKTVAGSYNLEVSSGNLVKATGSVNFTAAEAAALSLKAAPAVLNANGAAQSTLTATVVDAYGNKVTAGSYNVKFTKTAGATTATQAFADTTVATVDGVASVTITASLNNGGSDTYVASVSGLVSSSTPVTSAIMGAPAKLVVNAGDSTAAAKTAGSNAKVVVDVQDSASTLVTTDAGRVVTLTVKDADGNVTQTLTATSVNGKATFEWTETKSGAYTAVATADGLTKSGNFSQTFNAGSAAALKLTPSLTSLGADGSSTSTLNIKVVDKYGNTTSANGVTVNVASSNANVGALSATSTGSVNITTGGNNAITFTATSLPGTATITVSDAAGVLTSATADITSITVGTAVRGSVTVSGSPKVSGAAAPEYSVVTAHAVDASGNRVTNFSGTAKLTITNGTGNVKVYSTGTTPASGEIALASGTYDLAFTQGQAKFYVINDKAETLNYSVAVGAFPAVSGSATFMSSSIDAIAFEAPVDAYLLGNGNDVTVLKVVAKDSLGNTVTNATGTVYFKLSSGNDYATLLNTSASFVNGEAILSIQSKIATDSANLTILAWSDAKKADGVTALANSTEATALSNAAIMVDGKAPTSAGTVSLVGGAESTEANPALINANKPAFSVDSPADAGVGIGKVVFQYRLTSTTVWTTLYEDTTASSGVYAVDWTDKSALPNGTYAFRAVAYDNSGNSLASSTFYRKIDATPASVTSAVYSSSAATLTVTFTEAVANTATFSAQVSTTDATAKNLGAGTVTWSADRKVATIDVTGSDIAAGNAVKVTNAVDDAGNVSTITITIQ